ncbi:hypothetical protein BD779DRAFT_1675408 [Infundibulicybe gibba]|nr:hypothetical protein BD779DRAFT_1675408 [Infundibulicybe gibba]
MALSTSLNTLAVGVILECVFYGAYVVLFILYLVLQRRNNRRFGRPLTLAHILLFGLCTVSLFLDIPSDYLLIVPGVGGPGLVTAKKLNLGSILIFAMIDFLAQTMLLYRCWIIWGRRWVVIAVPGFLALLVLGGGFALAGLFNSSFWSTNPDRALRLFNLTGIAINSVSLAVNALTTLLIVTKIVLISRESLRIATAMLIESGLLILTFQLIYVVLYNREVFDIISLPAPQLYGITPTLLNIRVIMGSAYDRTAEKTRTLRFAHSERGATTQTTGTSMSAAGVRSRDINTELDDVPKNEIATGNAV